MEMKHTSKTVVSLLHVIHVKIVTTELGVEIPSMLEYSAVSVPNPHIHRLNHSTCYSDHAEPCPTLMTLSTTSPTEEEGCAVCSEKCAPTTSESTVTQHQGDTTEVVKDHSTESLSGGESCAVTGIALGGLSAVLLLTLIAVIMGWVWSRHRNKASVIKRCGLWQPLLSLQVS